mmetsp:Transcript_66888/g.59990  ORF Transcript_66888/g.59990 Transcript_66888/m.59990 type:complete len:711 (-) Transcript_66888:223-2355(-)
MRTRSSWSLLWTYILFIHSIIIHICTCQTDATPTEKPLDVGCPFPEGEENVESLIGGIVAIYIICLACAITIILYLVKFYQNRDDPNVENRHPRLVYSTVSMVIFMNIVLFPLAIDYWTLECVTHTPWLRNSELVEGSLSWIESFLIIAFVVLLLAWLILVVLRVWLLRYDYGASLANKSQIWKKDLGVHGGSSTWWLKHQQTWGDEVYLLKIVSIPYLFAVALAILLSPVFGYMKGAWTPMVSIVGVTAIILCLFIIINVWKVRSIHDNFHIKDEVLLFAKSSVVIAIILVIMFGISRGVAGVGDVDAQNWIVLIWSILVMGLLTIVSYIQTGWVLYGIQRKNEKSEKLVKSINDEWESNVDLQRVLKSKEGFEVFMDFLVAEYSTENLLCYVEATQFLRKWKYVIYRIRYLQNQNNKNGTTDTKSNQTLVSQATNFVQKQIIENNKNDDNDIDNQPWAFHDKESILIKFEWVKKPPVMKEENINLWDHFRYLRQKYISATSAHQVNIRSALYKHYTKISKEHCDLSRLDLSDVFNDPLHHQQISSNKLIGQSSGRGGINGRLSPNISAQDDGLSDISDIELDEDEDEEDDEDQSLQPGQVKKSKKNKKLDYEIEMGGTSKGESNGAIRRSQTAQYNRNLRNLDGVAKVLQLIEDTRKELWKNMNDSFVRFRSTESYVSYIKKEYLNRHKGDGAASDDRNDLYVGIDSD